MKKKKLNFWPYFFFAPFLVSYLAFSIYPIFYSFVISLTNWNIMNFNNWQWIGFQNYVNIFTKDTLFWKALWTTVKLLLMSLPITVVLGLLMAQFMFSIKKGRQLFQTLNFFPYITTPVAIGIIFSFLFDQNVGIVNQLLVNLHLIPQNINWLGSAKNAPFVVAILCIWKNYGYFMVLYLSGLSAIDPSLFEAAAVDGSNAVHTFFHITLPQLRPINVFILVNSTIGGLQMFDEPNLLYSATSSAGALVGGPERSVLTSVWYFFDSTFRNTSRLGYGSAIAFSLFLIICGVSVVNVIITRKKG